MYMLSSSRPSVKTDNTQKMNNKTTKDLDKWCNYLTIHKNVPKHAKKVANGGHRSKKKKTVKYVMSEHWLSQPNSSNSKASERVQSKRPIETPGFLISHILIARLAF